MEVIRKAGNISLPGFPAIITLSGEMMVSWSASDLTDFLKAGLDIMIKEFKRYPAVRMTSLQPPDRESALKMSEKIRAICEVAKSYAL